MLKGKTTLWRGFGTLEKWAADNLQYSLGTCPWLVMGQGGAHGLLSSPDSLILLPSSSVFKEQTYTRMSVWTVYPVPGLDPSGLPCCCHPDKGTPEISYFCYWDPDLFSYEGVQLEDHYCSHSIKSRGRTHKEVGFNERMGHAAVMK